LRRSIPACNAGPDDVLPLLSGGRRVSVDGHPICSCCGAAVEAVDGDRWRHAPGGRPRPRPPITPGLLRACGTLAAFRARHPGFACSDDDWREGVRRLEEYGTQLDAVRRVHPLRAGDNPYLDLVIRLQDRSGGWRMSPGLAQLLDLRARRRELASLFAWAIPNDEAIERLVRHAPLIECGAGTGYWAALLRARGADVIACDAAPPGGVAKNAHHRDGARTWTDVECAASVEAARRHRGRTLILCWPPYEDDSASYAVLRAYRGETVVYVGEPDDGATGSVRFHRELALNWSPVESLDLPNWPGLRDRIVVYRRNAEVQPHTMRDRCFECGRFIPTGDIGRCGACIALRPPALALRVGRHRVEYPAEVVAAMPPALRMAFERSPNRIRLPVLRNGKRRSASR